MLIEMLQLRNTEQWPTSAEGIGFAPMLEEAAPVFDELYCAVFAQFDDMWLQYGVAENGAFGHLDFNKIKGALQTRLSTCLKQRPGSFSQLVDSLHHPQAYGRLSGSCQTYSKRSLHDRMNEVCPSEVSRQSSNKLLSYVNRWYCE